MWCRPSETDVIRFKPSAMHTKRTQSIKAIKLPRVAGDMCACLLTFQRHRVYVAVPNWSTWTMQSLLNRRLNQSSLYGLHCKQRFASCSFRSAIGVPCINRNYKAITSRIMGLCCRLTLYCSEHSHIQRYTVIWLNRQTTKVKDRRIVMSCAWFGAWVVMKD